MPPQPASVAAELHALRWRHIDFDRREVRIETRVDPYGNEDVPKTKAGLRHIRVLDDCKTPVGCQNALGGRAMPTTTAAFGIDDAKSFDANLSAFIDSLAADDPTLAEVLRS
jgi:hypothetical protein